MTTVEMLEMARAAAAKSDWQTAYRLLSEADAAGTLPPTEWPVLAEIAYGAGHLDVVISTWERVHAERARAGDRFGAAEAAVRVAQHIILDTALLAPTRAWIVRAEKFLDGNEENPIFAWLCVVKNYERLLSGDFATARKWARRAIDVGSRHESGAAAVARVAEARSLILDGEVTEGLQLLDEAAAACFGSDLPAIPLGMILCELVCGAQGLAQYDRVEEWTTAYERWNPVGVHGSLRGRCRVHRAEILRLRGALEDAEMEAIAACEELRPYLRRELGWPITELGMIRLRRGDLERAEATFLEAHESAWDPHPGFALVRFARGDTPGALAAIQDALDHPMNVPSKERPPNTELRRVPLLDAKVEIATAAGDIDAARAAADELDRLATKFQSKAFEAIAATARGRVMLASGDAAGARARFEEAVRLWAEVGAPYEAAIARIGLGSAHRAAGNLDRGNLELAAARSVLHKIGAALPRELDDAPPSSSATAAATVTASTPSATIASPSTADIASSVANAFRREGDTWFVAFDGQSLRLRDLKGLRYLALLFADPGSEVHVLQLVARETGVSDPDVEHGDAGVMLDARSKEMYRRRLAEITDDLDEANARSDIGRAAQVEHEREFLVRELARAVGIGGRDRVASSASERARAGATRAVRQAIDRIREHHAALAEHLDRTIKTGTYFAYQPDPRAPVAWTRDPST